MLFIQPEAAELLNTINQPKKQIKTHQNVLLFFPLFQQISFGYQQRKHVSTRFRWVLISFSVELNVR